MNAMQRPFQATGLSLLQMFGLSIPLALLGPCLFGIVGIFSALALGYIMTGMFSMLLISRAIKQLHRSSVVPDD